MTHQVLDEAGRPLDAHLELDGPEVVFLSRGGKRGTPSARNLHYGRALRLLLDRIAAAGHYPTGVWLDSDEVRDLSRAERSILSGSDLSAAPADQFRILSRNMQTFGRAPDAAYGGSRVKKIRIAGDWPSDANAVVAMLGLATDDGSALPTRPRTVTGGASPETPRGAVPAEVPSRSDDDPATLFDPSSIEDGRERVVTLVKRRQGQASFRRALLRAYDGRCAISGCAIEPLLEAAHIHPYRGPNTNDVQNGLLLRADIHTLFDLGLIVVDEDRRIRTSASLSNTDYASLDGVFLSPPTSSTDRPSTLALEWHRQFAAIGSRANP